MGPEAVRLVVWDLDDTFWKGTVVEGGIEQVAAHHEIVKTLAARGILSSICSKNDMATVKAILEQQGLWDYFIFPSVDWTSKGARLKQIVEDVQLRPETILFIDDNHLNRAEASFAVPGLQVRDVDVIAELLASPLCKGKDDSGLERLKQYKTLEAKKVAGEGFGDDNAAFLRSCNIRVAIETDVERHIDRAVELVNRTNQLNFTKRRLREDPEAARAALLNDIQGFGRLAGLVRVLDDYGDYGFVGFFSGGASPLGNSLKHFCFSCRTLGMGIETFIYRHLHKPGLKIVGDVVNDVTRDDRPLDWIRLVLPEELDAGGGAADAKAFPALGKIIIRGACEMLAISHYLTGLAPEVTLENLQVYNGFSFHHGNFAQLKGLQEGLDEADLAALDEIGVDRAAIETRLTEPAGHETQDVWILSMWGEVTGLIKPKDRDGLRMFRPVRWGDEQTDKTDQVAGFLADHYAPCPPMSESELETILARALEGLGPKGLCILMLDVESQEDNLRGRRVRAVNQYARNFAARYPNVVTVDPTPHAEGHHVGGRHFGRLFYQQVGLDIREAIRRRFDAGDAGESAKRPLEPATA